MTEEYFVTEDGRGAVKINEVYYTMLDGRLCPLFYSGKYTGSDGSRVCEMWEEYQVRIEELAKTAEEIARRAHAGQKDRSGADYIEHPLTVAKTCRDTESKIVALLHDMIEDTDVTAGYLIEQGFPGYLVHAVELVTKETGFDEDDYMERISRDPVAREVKMADLMHNMDMTRLKDPTEKDWCRQEKYQREFRFLYLNGGAYAGGSIQGKRYASQT